MRGKKEKILVALVMAAAAAGLAGCSRSVLNYQIAECIGTLDQYENNEPVETPKMQAEREQRESEEALEAEKTAALEEAAAMAAGYRYEEAIALLEGSDVLAEDERATEAVADYQKKLNAMYEYTGDIGHLSFTNLVVDTDLAFDGDEYASIYETTMITLSEFEKILDSLYQSGYILIDIHSLAEESETGEMTAKPPVIPEGKKPLVLSVENLNYSTVRNGDGVATRLDLDGDGNVVAVYTDAGGHELRGAYDVVPVVEQFIEEHPDFSFQGARGIIGLSGVNGIFGYQIEEGSSVQYESNAETAGKIAAALREDGWTFASEGYGYKYMNEMNYDSLKEDITKWQTVVGAVIGECDTLLYPYGAEVDYTTEKGAFVVNQGFCYVVGLWADGDHLEVQPTYLRQTRRTVTGYVFEVSPSSLSTYFSVSSILDAAR